MKKRAHVAVCIALLVSSHTFSQIKNPSGGVSVRASMGFAYLPLPAWTEFWDEVGTFYRRNNPNVYYGLSVHYSWSSVHSFNFGSELLRTSAFLTDNSGFGPIEWKFQAIPITLGYEYNLLRFHQFFSIVAEVGASYFFSKLTGQVPSPGIAPVERTGEGYGIHVSSALVSDLSESLALVTQIRYRYSDGMAFTDRSESVKIEFTGFDLSVGLGWTVY